MSESPSPLQPIYAYEDYRAYLRDAFEARKKADPEFSYRRFSEVAGVRNPGYLVDIIKGKRNITPRILDAATTLFEISGKEAEFLKLLIAFSHTKSGIAKEKAYQELLNRRHHSNFVRVNPAQSRYYEDPLYALIIGAVQAFDFRGDFESFAAFLEPPIPAGRLKKAVRDLCEWDLLKQERNGHYTAVHRFLEPPASMGSLVRRINRQLMHEGADHASHLSKGERHISTLMLSVTHKTRKKIEAKIELLRREILEMAKADSEAEEVIQLGLLLLPRTKVRDRSLSAKGKS